VDGPSPIVLCAVLVARSLMALVCLFAGTQALALHQESPGTAPLVQVTNGPGNPDNPSIATIPSPPAAADHWLAFEADGSFGNLLTGAATTRRQIFL